MATEAQELEQLEKAHGTAPESEFGIEDEDSPIDTLKSEEFQDEEDSQPEKDTSQKASEEPPKETQWDKERQRADQAEANFRKTSTELDSTRAKLDAQGKQIESMQKSLDEYAKANEVSPDELDDELVDPGVKKVLKSMQAKVDAAKAEVETLKQARDDITKRLNADAADTRRASQQAKIIADIEAEFPSKLRNAAIAKADKVCKDRGYAPEDRHEAYMLLRAAYKELAEKPATHSKTSVATDTGASANTVVSEDNKPTTLKEAANQWRKKLGLKKK
jgi:hypothetical protein